MMRVTVLIGALAALGATSALAQSPPAPPPPPPGVTPRPPLPDGDDWMARHRRFMEMQRYAEMPKMGAGFRFRRGDAEIDVRCPSDESTKECVDAAGTLIEKVLGSTPR